jgi:hypothetical protein
MKALKYIFTLIVAIAFYHVLPKASSPDVTLAIAPALLAAIIGGAASLGGAGLNLAAGSLKNQRRRQNAQADSTLNLTNKLFGGATDAMGGDLSRLSNTYNQFGLTANKLRGLDRTLAAQMGKSYLDSAEGSSILEGIKQGARDSKNKLRNDASLMGLSEEAYVAGLGGINKSKGNATASLAGNANAFKNNLMNQRMNLTSLLNQTNNAQGRMALSRAGLLGNAYANAGNQASNIFGQSNAALQGQMNGINQGIGNAAQLLMMGLTE